MQVCSYILLKVRRREKARRRELATCLVNSVLLLEITRTLIHWWHWWRFVAPLLTVVLLATVSVNVVKLGGRFMTRAVLIDPVSAGPHVEKLSSNLKWSCGPLTKIIAVSFQLGNE